MAKGKNVERHDKKKTDLSDEEIGGLMLGPTGNLRAPTMRIKKKLYVGFPKEGFEGL